MVSLRTVSTFSLQFTICYSVLAKAIEAQVVSFYNIYALCVVGYLRTFCTTVWSFTKDANFLWRK